VTKLAEKFVARLVRAYFTKTNLLLHVIVYPVLMSLEGGDFHLFLDGISIEAVFVGLLVGISTKTIIDQHHGVREALHALTLHVRRQHDAQD
jgi:hypothetical protein